MGWCPKARHNAFCPAISSQPRTVHRQLVSGTSAVRRRSYWSSVSQNKKHFVQSGRSATGVPAFLGSRGEVGDPEQDIRVTGGVERTPAGEVTTGQRLADLVCARVSDLPAAVHADLSEVDECAEVVHRVRLALLYGEAGERLGDRRDEERVAPLRRASDVDG